MPSFKWVVGTEKNLNSEYRDYVFKGLLKNSQVYWDIYKERDTIKMIQLRMEPSVFGDMSGIIHFKLTWNVLK